MSEQKMSLYQYFEETPIGALRFIKRGKPKILQFFWFLVFLLGLAATGKSVFDIVQSFASRPTATEMKIISHSHIILPRVYIFSRNRFNDTKIKHLNISEKLLTLIITNFILANLKSSNRKSILRPRIWLQHGKHSRYSWTKLKWTNFWKKQEMNIWAWRFG